MLKKILAKIEKNESIDFPEALELIQLEGKDCMELFSLANHVRSKLGDRVDLCSIINAKCGLCSEDCKFCAQSVHNDTDITPYPMMEEEEILNMAQMMEEEGSARFCIVTSGKGVGGEDFENMLSSIRRIKKETRLSVCISSGMLTDERALALKSAGATRLHHNLETSKSFFNKICTTHTYDDKIKTIHIAQEAGFEVCCGGIIGMGESVRDRLELAFTLRELDVDSIPINILNPIKGTPLDNEKPIRPLDIMKTISVFRLILPGKNIRIAGGREKNLRDLQGLCLLAGANGLLLGNYLTTQGRTPRDDIMMINDLGLIPGGVHVQHQNENGKKRKTLARKLLLELGIPKLCIEKSISLLEKGPANGENMRGAIIMDLNGNRLEPDIVRGIRASHIGITEEASKELQKAISDMRLSAFYTYISDALVLATKVASVKGTLGELCWSDDPSYTAGYVASGKMGYIRIPHLKKKGNPCGGRVFFVENIDPGNYINEMESSPVLVNRFGGIRKFKG